MNSFITIIQSILVYNAGLNILSILKFYNLINNLINKDPSPIPTPLKESHEGFFVKINELIALMSSYYHIINYY